MPDNDILGSLLSSSLGQQNDSVDPEEIGALAAYQHSPFLQGEPSRSGPIGQISQALMPLISAKIYGQQAEQNHQAQTLEHLTDIIKLSNALDDRHLKVLKAEAEKDPSGQMSKVFDLVQTFREKTGGKMAGGKLSTKIGGMEMTLPLGDPEQKPLSGEFGLIDQMLQGDPKAKAILDADQNRRLDVARTQAQAQAEGRAAGTPVKLKPLTPADASEYASFATSIKSLDDAIGEFSSGQVSKADVLKSSLSGGLLSNPTLRKYATFYNDVAQSRFKSRVTQAEMARLSQELPPPTSYLADPQKFVDSLSLARQHAADKIAKKLTYESKSYDIPDELRSDITDLAPTASTTPLGAHASAGAKSPDIVIPDDKVAEVGQMIEKLKKTHTEQETMKIMHELYGE